MKKRKAIAAAGAVLALVMAAGWAAAPGLIRSEIQERAAGYGAKAEVRDVRLHFGWVELRGLETSMEEGMVRVREVHVHVDLGLRVRSVEAAGVRAELKGSAKEALSKRRGTGAEKGGTSRTLIIHGVDVDWEGLSGDGSRMKVEGASVWIAGGRTLAEAGRAEVRKGRLEAVVERARYDSWDPGTLSVQSVKAKVMEPVPGGTAGLAGAPAPEGLEGEKKLVAGKAELEAGGEVLRAEGLEAVADLGKAELRMKARSLELDGKAAANGFRASVKAGPGWRSAEVRAEADQVSTWSGRVAEGELLAKKVVASASVSVRGGEVEMAHGSLQFGKAKLSGSGAVGPARAELEARLEIAKCQDLLESAPPALVGKLGGAVLSGEMEASVHVWTDLPARKKPEVGIKLKNGCRVESVPAEMDVKALRRPFRREVYEKDGKGRKTVMSGPGTPGWTPLGLVSSFVPLAVRTLEDPGFMSHRGFLIQAFENSLIQNIQAGRFVRGGSTISMQLAKNLWLVRDKTVSRKLQEAVLTLYLEQKMSKEEILEYYVNVVEFGPDVYGIGAASEHYFSKHPANLTLSQSLFLASILPRPRAAYFGPDGRLPAGRLFFLKRMMRAMLDRGLVSKDEYEEGIREVPVFGQASATAEEAPGQEPLQGDGIAEAEWR